MTESDLAAIEARANAASHPPYSLSAELPADWSLVTNVLADVESTCATLRLARAENARLKEGA